MRKNMLVIVAVIVSIATCSQTGGSRTARGSTAAFETKQSVFFADGSLDEYTTSEWDKDYTRVNSQARYSASGAMIEQVEFSYNEDSNELLTKLTRDVERRLKNRVVYRFNPQGRLYQESLVDNKGKIVSTYEYGYDGQGNRTSRVIKNRSGDKLAETAYTYDGQNRMATSETRDFAESTISSTKYTYDAQGNLIKQEVVGGDGKVTSVISSVWQDGREIRNEMTSADGKVQLRVTNEYGDNGELVRKTIENFQGESKQVMQYEYTFRAVRG